MARPAYRTAGSVLMLAALLLNGHQTWAQESAGSKKVTVSFENADIRNGLKILFESAGLNYTVDPAVNGTVSVSLTDVPFRTALETVLRATGKPLTYRVENGIYQIVPQNTAPSALLIPRVVKLQINYASAVEVVQQLKSIPAYAKMDVNLQALPRDNTVVVTYSDDDTLRELREGIRLLDVQARHIQVKAELILTVNRAGQKHSAVFDAVGSTQNEKLLTMKNTISNGGAAISSLTVQEGQYNVRVTPRLNGDNTVSLDSDATVDFTLRIPGAAKPLHLNKGFNGILRAGIGQTVLLTGTIIKLDGTPASDSQLEMLLFLTPTITTSPVPKGEPVVGRLYTTIVADFDDAGGETGDALASEAQKAVVQEMAATARFEFLKPEDVEAAALRLRLEQPYGPVELRKIARQLGASVILTGKIASIGRSARVTTATLHLGVEDVADGTPVLGATHTGEATAGGAATDREGLVRRAIRSAAYLAVSDLVNTAPAEGNVLTSPSVPSRGSTIVISVGTDDGIRVGTQLLVLRAGTRVGKVQVVRAGPFSSEARVLDDQHGIRPEDYVRAVTFEPGPATASAGPLRP